jgi:hypothetical protein
MKELCVFLKEHFGLRDVIWFTVLILALLIFSFISNKLIATPFLTITPCPACPTCLICLTCPEEPNQIKNYLHEYFVFYVKKKLEIPNNDYYLREYENAANKYSEISKDQERIRKVIPEKLSYLNDNFLQKANESLGKQDWKNACDNFKLLFAYTGNN